MNKEFSELLERIVEEMTVEELDEYIRQLIEKKQYKILQESNVE